MKGIPSSTCGIKDLPTDSSRKMSNFELERDSYRAFVNAAECFPHDMKVEGCTSTCATANFFSQSQPNGGEPLNNTTSTVYQSRNLAEAYGDARYCSRTYTRGSGAGSRSTGRSLSREKAVATDRVIKSKQRRLRIADRLKALQELLPYNVEGGQLSQLDEIINHIKSLQLPILDLSHTRLGGEIALDPLIYLEGRGRFMIHEEMLDEPLEEKIEKLNKFSSSADIQLLESRGLYIVPATLVDDLDQAI